MWLVKDSEIFLKLLNLKRGNVRRHGSVKRYCILKARSDMLGEEEKQKKNQAELYSYYGTY